MHAVEIPSYAREKLAIIALESHHVGDKHQNAVSRSQHHKTSYNRFDRAASRQQSIGNMPVASKHLRDASVLYE